MGRKAQAEHTKIVILQAAIDLYAERGFRGTGLMAIGARAGVAHATVLYHYGSSRELLMAVLDERERRFQQAAGWACRRSGLDILRHLPDVARFHLAEPKLAKLFAVLQAENLEPDQDANAFFRQSRREVREVLQRHLHRAVATGEIRSDVDVDCTIDEVLAFTTGAQIQHWLAPEEVDLVALYENFTDTLIRELTRDRDEMRG